MPQNTETGKYSHFNNEIIDNLNKGVKPMDISRHLIKKYDNDELSLSLSSLNSYISRFKSRIEMVKAMPAEPTVDHLKEQLRAIIMKKGRDVHSLEELSNGLDCGIGKVRTMLDELRAEGFIITVKDSHVVTSRVIEKSPNTQLNVSKMTTGYYRFGVVGDNHLGSRYERLDVLNALYEVFAEEGIGVVYNTGNWIDGEARFNKHDLHVHGMGNQLQYMINKYPRIDGITTYYVAGDDHEGWYTQREGVNIGQMLEMMAQRQGRNDLVHLGYMEADIDIPAPNGKTTIRVVHPGGGSAYATSYTMQKLVESYQGGEKPHIVLAGHYHKAEYLYYRGVHIIQSGTTEDQTPFMRKKKLSAHLGGWIIEFGTDDNGAITRFKQEFFPFYDNNYYKKWTHKG
jgi:biotin operon repressor